MKVLSSVAIVILAVSSSAFGQPGPGPIVYRVEGMDSVLITRDQVRALMHFTAR